MKHDVNKFGKHWAKTSVIVFIEFYYFTLGQKIHRVDHSRNRKRGYKMNSGQETE